MHAVTAVNTVDWFSVDVKIIYPSLCRVSLKVTSEVSITEV